MRGLSAIELLEQELGPAPELQPERKKEPRSISSHRDGFDVFGAANGVDTIVVLDWLGIAHESTPRGEMATCPGCGEDGALVGQEGGLKCLHDRCSGAGPTAFPGFRTNVDLVVLRERIEPLEAAKRICERVGIDVPRAVAKPRAVPPAAGQVDDWPVPIPLDDPSQLPAFPLDALPRTIREWVVAVSESTQTPPELAAGLALAVIAAAVQKRYEVDIRPGWREPLSLFLIVALLPGERKSAVYRLATRALREWEAGQAMDAEPKIRAAITAKAVKEKRAKKALDQAATSGLATDLQRATEIDIELHEMRVPAAPRLFADDVTPEKLSGLMHEHGGRMAVLSAEGGIFETVGGRYSDGTPNIDVLLKGHAGDQIKVDRKNSAPVHIERPALTLGLCVQPDVIDGLASKPQFRGRGLLGRCLYIMPPSKVGFREICPAPMDAMVEESFDQLVRDLLALPEDRAEDGEIRARMVRFSPAARRELEAFAAELEPRLAPGADLEPIRDWATKLVGASARIAALLHLAEVSSGCEGSERSEGVESFQQRAKKIGSFLLDHALAAYRSMGADPAVSGARVILSHLTTLTTLTTSKRDIHQALRAAFKRAIDIDEPLRVLEEHGHIRVTEQEASRQGGRRPSPIIEINPRARKGAK